MKKIRSKTWHTCIKCKEIIKIGEPCFEERTIPRYYCHEKCYRKVYGMQGSLLTPTK